MDTAGSLSLRRYGPSPGSHSHGHFQVLLGLAGALDLEVDGRGMRVASGGGCVIAPGAHHDFEASGGSLCLVLDSSDMGWTHCTAPALQSAPPPPALTLARYLASALQQGRPLAQAHGPALLLEAWRPCAPWIPQPPDAGARRRAKREECQQVPKFYDHVAAPAPHVMVPSAIACSPPPLSAARFSES